MAPPGKLGITLVNQINFYGAVISSVHPTSVLSKLVLLGDRILEIVEEDVSWMDVTEITAIITGKLKFERKLVLMATQGSGTK